MTTTARELAEKLLNDYTLTVATHSFLIDDIEEAILDAEARGRESVLSRVPSEDEIMETDRIDWDEPLGVYHFILAKLKEPT